MPVIRPSQFSDLLLSLYAAPANWPEFLRQFRSLTAADGVALIQFDRQTRLPNAHHIGYDSAEWRRYVSHYAAINPWMPQAQPPAPLPQGNVITGSDILSPKAYEKTEYFNAWGKANLVYHSIAANISLTDREFLYLCANRGHRARPHPASTAQLLRLLLPHLRRVLQSHIPVPGLSTLTHVLDSFTLPALLLDEHARVHEMSALAHKLVHNRDGIELHHGIATAPNLALEIHTFLREFAPQSRLFRLPRPHGGEFIGLLLKTGTAGRLLLVLLDPHAQSSRGVALAAGLYGLTPAETAFVETLLETGSLDRTIEARQITRNTARTQMASIFRKTGATRQGQVIRLFSTLARVTHVGDDAAAHSA